MKVEIKECVICVNVIDIYNVVVYFKLIDKVVGGFIYNVFIFIVYFFSCDND